jgi:hypothetical protein
MDYFNEGQEPEIDEVVASAPPPEKIPVPPAEEEIPAETIEITNKSVLPYLIPRENKKWHFTLNDTNKEQLTRVLESIPTLTVQYADKKDDAGITLQMNGEDVGKIHFLLCDRPNINLSEKYYCKLYFYEFKNQELYNKVKTSLINFFENFKQTNATSMGGRRLKKRITRRKNKRLQRKKTSKRVSKNKH